MDIRNSYTSNKIVFDYKEPTCRDRLKLSAEKDVLVGNSLPYEKIIDMLDVKIKVENQEYNIDTLPRQHFKDLLNFANYIVVEMFKDFVEQEKEEKK